MAYPSSIDKLPDEVRALIGRLRGSGWTIDEILAHLNKLDLVEDAISRSALARHTQKIDALTEHLKLSRGMATAVMERLEDQDDDKTARMNMELMQSLLFQLLMGEDGKPVELTPKDAMQLATTLQRLAGAGKSDVERVRKIRELAATEARQHAAADAEETAKEAGLSADVVAQIKSKILGVSA